MVFWRGMVEWNDGLWLGSTIHQVSVAVVNRCSRVATAAGGESGLISRHTRHSKCQESLGRDEGEDAGVIHGVIHHLLVCNICNCWCNSVDISIYSCCSRCNSETRKLHLHVCN